MRRSELEAQLVALDLDRSAQRQASAVWTHRRFPGTPLFIPTYEIIWDSNAFAILRQAVGRLR